MEFEKLSTQTLKEFTSDCQFHINRLIDLKKRLTNEIARRRKNEHGTVEQFPKGVLRQAEQ